MRPYDARSSVTLEKLGFVVREPQSHLELTYFLPKISAFMLISGNWANIYNVLVQGICVLKSNPFTFWYFCPKNGQKHLKEGLQRPILVWFGLVVPQ